MPKKSTGSIVDALAKLPRNNRVDPFRRLSAAQQKEFEKAVEYFRTNPDHPSLAASAKAISECLGITISEHWLEKKLRELNVKH